MISFLHISVKLFLLSNFQHARIYREEVKTKCEFVDRQYRQATGKLPIFRKIGFQSCFRDKTIEAQKEMPFFLGSLVLLDSISYGWKAYGLKPRLVKTGKIKKRGKECMIQNRVTEVLFRNFFLFLLKFILTNDSYYYSLNIMSQALICLNSRRQPLQFPPTLQMRQLREIKLYILSEAACGATQATWFQDCTLNGYDISLTLKDLFLYIAINIASSSVEDAFCDSSWVKVQLGRNQRHSSGGITDVVRLDYST